MGAFYDLCEKVFPTFILIRFKKKDYDVPEVGLEKHLGKNLCIFPSFAKESLLF